jgi:hypothetical protein
MTSDSEPRHIFWTFRGYLRPSKIGLLGGPSFLLGARPPSGPRDSSTDNGENHRKTGLKSKSSGKNGCITQNYALKSNLKSIRPVRSNTIKFL